MDIQLSNLFNGFTDENVRGEYFGLNWYFTNAFRHDLKLVHLILPQYIP
jgi:hypothetical protein